MGCLEGWRIIDAIAGHRDDLTAGFERIDDAQLLFGHGAGEYRDIPQPPNELIILTRLQLLAGHNLRRRNPSLLGDGSCGGRIVAGNHDDTNPGRPTFRDGARYALTQGVRQANYAQEREDKGLRIF